MVHPLYGGRGQSGLKGEILTGKVLKVGYIYENNALKALNGSSIKYLRMILVIFGPSLLLVRILNILYGWSLELDKVASKVGKMGTMDLKVGLGRKIYGRTSPITT